MPKQIISDDVFIKTWNTLNSPSKVSEVLGLNLRTVNTQRRNIEKRYNIILGTNPYKADTESNIDPKSAKIVTNNREDVIKLDVQDGIVVIGSDCHYTPNHIPTAHKAMCNVIVDLGTKVRAIILNGDVLDGGTISRHPETRFGTKPTLFQELEAVQERLGDFEKIARGARLLRTIGNHDLRMSAKLVQNSPQYEGVCRTLVDYIPLWKEALRIEINLDTIVIHDWHFGVHSGWNDVLKSGGFNVITGHTHELSVKGHRGFGGTKYGIKTGMIADEFQSEFDYRMGKPGFNWQSGFVVLTFKDGILLYPEICAVRDDGCAYFRGVRYA